MTREIIQLLLLSMILEVVTDFFIVDVSRNSIRNIGNIQPIRIQMQEVTHLIIE